MKSAAEERKKVQTIGMVVINPERNLTRSLF